MVPSSKVAKMNKNELIRPFDYRVINTLDHNGQKYVKSQHYIRRLNKAFDFNWNIEILEHWIVDDEVIVKIKFTTEGIVKQAFGAGQKKGRKTWGDVYKSAYTDAIKKVSATLGVGLDVYVKREPGNE
jgi:hypothetical protein